MTVRVFLLFVSALLCSTCLTKKLVVVLIDGARWDYLDDPQLRGFARMATLGVKAKKAVPVFPSLSYPNWATLVTGLYPESQGFVDNNMFDNRTATFFENVPAPKWYSTDPIWWNEAEPIWITAEKNRMPAALYWWAACEVEIRGEHPTICERYRFGPPNDEERMDFLERIDDLVQLFQPSKRTGADRMSLAMMYYGGVDYAGHHYGPNSKERKEAMRDIDEILDKMQEKFRRAGLDKEVNIMVVSDHGMTDISSAKGIDLDRFKSSIKYQMSAGPISAIIPHDGMVEKLHNDLFAAKINGLQFYMKNDIPEHYHIKNSRRMTPLFLEAKKGYLINLVGAHSTLVGHHGYNPAEVSDMNALFLAMGPAFKKGYVSEEVHNIDLYNVMCSVLGLQPLPNNGSWSRVQDLLVKPDDPQSVTDSSAHHLTTPLPLYILSALTSILISWWTAKSSC